MGLFNLFKKKELDKKIKLSEIDNWIRNKEEEFKKKNNEVIKQISDSKKEIIFKLKENKKTLENVEIDSKKENEKIKLIVKENLEKYIEALTIFIKNLESINNESLISLISKIDESLVQFSERSSMHFEKATILIGKELGNVKENIGEFSRSLKESLKENKGFIDESRILDQIKKDDSKLKEIEKVINESKDFLKNISEKKEKTHEEINKNKNKLKKIKESKDYKTEENKIKDIEDKKKNLEKEINLLRSRIDFKKLSSIFHSDAKKMEKINDYKNNFKELFLKDEEDFKKLLKEGEIFSESINEKISQINSIKNSLSSLSVKKDLIHECERIEENIKKLNEEITYLNLEEEKENKKISRFSEHIKEILTNISQSLSLINIALE